MIDPAVPPTGRNRNHLRFFQHGISKDAYDILTSRKESNPYWILAGAGLLAAAVEFGTYFVLSDLVRNLGAEEYWSTALSLGPWFYALPFLAFGLVFAVLQVVQNRRRRHEYRQTVAALDGKITWTAELSGQDKKIIRRVEDLHRRLQRYRHDPAAAEAYQACIHTAVKLFAVPPLTPIQNALADNDPRLTGSPALALAEEFRATRAERHRLLTLAEAALRELEQIIGELEQREEDLLLIQEAERLWLERADATIAPEPGE